MAKKIYYRNSAPRVVAVPSTSRNNRRLPGKYKNALIDSAKEDGARTRWKPRQLAISDTADTASSDQDQECTHGMPSHSSYADLDLRRTNAETATNIETNETGGMNRCATQTTAVDGGPTFILFRLPRELRDAIYQDAFLDLPDTILLQRTDHHRAYSSLRAQEAAAQRFPGIVPAFCYTNRQMYYESLPIFVAGRKIILGFPGAVNTLANFLNRVASQRAFEAVRELTLESIIKWRSQHDSVNDPDRTSLDNILYWWAGDLIHHCIGLRHITTSIDGHYLTHHVRDPTGSTTHSRISVKTDVGELLPAELFTLPQLRTLNMIYQGGETYERLTKSLATHHPGQDVITKEQIFAPMTAWIQQEMTKKKVTWKLNVRYEEENRKFGAADYKGWAPEEGSGA
jgi:hypothetical protein